MKQQQIPPPRFRVGCSYKGSKIVSRTPPGHRIAGEREMHGTVANILVKDENQKGYIYTLEAPNGRTNIPEEVM
jgi:hypothetical protein